MSFPLSLSIMKLPLKHIVILVICSLTGIFVYQAYWLTGLYRTMKQEMENNIIQEWVRKKSKEIFIHINDDWKDCTFLTEWKKTIRE